MTDPIRVHLRALMAASAEMARKRTTYIETLEGQGHRIVDGGQTGRNEQTGESTWEILDWRTRERLAEGEGWSAYEEASLHLGESQNWIHIDQIGNELYETQLTMITPGVPEGLAVALEEWLHSGDHEEIAEFLGCSADEVDEHQWREHHTY